MTRRDAKPKPTAERARLLEERERLEARLRELDAELALPPHSPAERKRAGRPVRVAVLDALEDLGVLAYTRELIQYLAAQQARQIPASRFGTLSSDEAAAFDKGRPQSVYLCHGLTHDRFEPIKRLWGRSDWPLAERIVAPTTGRTQHLRLTARLCDLGLSAAAPAADLQMLKIIAADHACDVRGVKVVKGRFELETWRDAALRELATLERLDRERREEAAERLAALAPRTQLFGQTAALSLVHGRTNVGG